MKTLCPKCGTSNLEGASLCQSCSHALSVDPLDEKTESPWERPGSKKTDPVYNDPLDLDGPTVSPETLSNKKTDPVYNDPLDLDGPTVSPETLSNKNILEAQSPFIPQSRYEILEEMGAGGMGKVYKAMDRQSGRVVAMKRLLSFEDKSNHVIERFQREAQTIASLNHPFIVPLFDVGRDEEGHFLTMQFIDGITLTEYVKERRGLKTEEAIDILLKISQAVFYAHQQRVIHRDIKPANIMLDKNGFPRLLDFGLARATGEESDLSVSGVFMGTRHYASPEQMNDTKHVDHRTDIYSLGATLYFALTGKSPKVLRKDRIPPNLYSIVLKCLKENPADRYYSVDELMSMLEKERLGQPQSPPSKTSRRMPATLRCTECEEENPKDANICQKCGQRLWRICPECGKEVRIHVKVCGYCGIKKEDLLLKAREFEKKKLLSEALGYCEKAQQVLEENQTASMMAQINEIFQQGESHFGAAQKFFLEHQFEKSEQELLCALECSKEKKYLELLDKIRELTKKLEDQKRKLKPLLKRNNL